MRNRRSASNDAPKSVDDEAGLAAGGLDLPVEAGAAARVAAAAVARDLDFEDEGILIAIDPHFQDGLDLPAGRALVPEFTSGAGPVPGLAGLQGYRQCLRVHV